MSEILFVTWDGGGNVPPALAIAGELTRRGETVRFLGHPTQRDTVAAAGFGFAPYEAAPPFSSTEENGALRLLSLFTDSRMAEDLRAELRRRPADLVVVDCLLLGALRACVGLTQPYVVLEHSFDASVRESVLRGPLGLIARVKRLRPGRTWESAQLTLACTLPSLETSRPSGRPANLRFTGPAQRVPAPHDLESHEPAVLVSLSTFRFSGMVPALQRVLDATADLAARVVVTTGPAVDPSELRAGANHEVHRYVPHDELMPHVSLVVGHGGHATTMRALAHDLPLVVMPMDALTDQPLVADVVARAGAGARVAKKAGPDQLRPHIERLLDDGPHRVAAASLGAQIRELDGTRGAADLLQGVLRAPASS